MESTDVLALPTPFSTGAPQFAPHALNGAANDVMAILRTASGKHPGIADSLTRQSPGQALRELPDPMGHPRRVPANDVRALAGSVEEKRTPSGILVTTAWVRPESKAFAARNNRLQIIEGGELKHLLEEYLHIDVRIDLAPPTEAS